MSIIHCVIERGAGRERSCKKHKFSNILFAFLYLGKMNRVILFYAAVMVFAFSGGK